MARRWQPQVREGQRHSLHSWGVEEGRLQQVMGAQVPSLRSHIRFSLSKLSGSKRKLQRWGNNEKGSLFPPSPNS